VLTAAGAVGLGEPAALLAAVVAGASLIGF